MAYQGNPSGFPHQRGHHAAPAGQAGQWQQPSYGQPQYAQPAPAYSPPQNAYGAPAPVGYAANPNVMRPVVHPQPNYAQPQQYPPQQQYAGGYPPQQQPPYGQAMGGDPFASVAANPLAQMGLSYGRNFVQSKMGFFHWLSFGYFRYYFHVSNSYVLNKLKILVFPFVHKNWKREEVQTGGIPDEHGDVFYKPPREDINAPDLYIPMMAFITYILLVGLALGVHHKFTPEVLSLSASSAAVFLFFEILIMKSGFYLLGNVKTPPVLDLMAYCGYKYVGLLIDLGVGILVGSSNIFYLVVGINAFFATVFMLRTVSRLTTPVIASGVAGDDDGAAARRNYFLLGLAVIQFLFSFFLVRNAVPSAAV